MNNSARLVLGNNFQYHVFCAVAFVVWENKGVMNTMNTSYFYNFAKNNAKYENSYCYFANV